MSHQRGWNPAISMPVPTQSMARAAVVSPSRIGRATLRSIVLVLATLAVAKVGYREYLYRTSMIDVIGSAYRERAIQACQLEPRNANLGLKPSAWAAATTERLAIGKPGLGIYIWQIDNAAWNARYRNPYLILRPAQRASQVLCEYDIVNGAASLLKM